MKKVLLRAPLLSRSGYGVHSRQVFRYLLQNPNIDVSTQILPWGVTSWCVDHDQDNGLIGEALTRSIQSANHQFDVSVQVQLPNEWDASLAKKNVGITAAVETDFSNPSWASVHCSKMDLVIVPSQHAKNSLTSKTFTRTPVEVVPETFFEEILSDASIDVDLSSVETSFNFLTVGVLTGLCPETDRKNTLYLIKWFLEEFKEDPDVGLIIKTNQGRDTTIDRKVTKKMLRQVLKEIKVGDFPRVYLLHGTMDRESMAALYKHEKVKAFVSATRGEGFGLPFIEAAASNLPVLATDWSAHTEFLNLGKWIKFDSNLVPISDRRVDNEIFMKGMQWAEVDEKDFKAKIRKFRLNSSLPQSWAEDLGQKIRADYSWSEISKIYDRVLGELLS